VNRVVVFLATVAARGRAALGAALRPRPAAARPPHARLGVLVSIVALSVAVTALWIGCGDTPTAAFAVARSLVASVYVLPANDSLPVGQSKRLVAVVNDVAGIALPSYPVTWAADDTVVAAVDSTGLVQALTPGGVQVTATANGHSASASLTVISDSAAAAVRYGLLFQDDFENGYAPRQNGAGWTNTAPLNVAVATDVAHSGTHSLRFLYRAKAECLDATAEQRFTFGHPLPEVWLEYYIHYPAGGEGGSARYYHRNEITAGCADGSSNNKFISLFGPNYGGETTFGLQTWPSRVSAAGDSRIDVAYSKEGRNGVWFYPGANADPFITDAERGQWLQIRVHARVADFGQADGVIQLWKNGTMVLNAQGLDWYDSTGRADFLLNGYLMGWSNSGYSEATNIYIDDFKLYDTNPGW